MPRSRREEHEYYGEAGFEDGYLEEPREEEDEDESEEEDHVGD